PLARPFAPFGPAAARPEERPPACSGRRRAPDGVAPYGRDSHRNDIRLAGAREASRPGDRPSGLPARPGVRAGLLRDLHPHEPRGGSLARRRRPARGVLMRPPRSPGVVFGASVLLLLALLAILAPWVAPGQPDRQDLARRFEAPSARHPLGRDELGRDVLTRLIWGARISLCVGIAVVLLSSVLGTALGTVAGYSGGWLDVGLMALVDLLLGFPGVLLAIALVSVLGPRLENLILALCLIGWVTYARL